MKNQSSDIKLIHGDLLLDPRLAGGDFVMAEATNTRLMGVVGLHIRRKTESGFFDQLFYLDFEEYGFDDYESYSDVERLNIAMKRLFGGLGGRMVSLTEREALFLICLASTYNANSGLELPYGTDEYKAILDYPVKLNADQRLALFGKISEDIKTDEALVNYYIMRVVAMDMEAARFLRAPEGNYDTIKMQEPGTLHRNVIEQDSESKNRAGLERKYITTSLIEDDSVYRVIRGEISLLGPKVTGFSIVSDMVVSQWEATNILRRDEYISFTQASDKSKDSFRHLIETRYPDAAVHIHPGGILYMLFHDNNSHVNKAIYRLDDDVSVSIYLKNNGEVLIASKEPEYIQGPQDALDNILTYNKEFTVVHNRYLFPEPTLGTFILGDQELYDSFLEFIQIFSSTNEP